ncbi:hypothetical protein NHX12_030925 [Muraenolepis orangiensis]|uniref:Uncharacterized protein n=1 Tax=Muraenolepis orangiensis TaxID=630683 RepID=A0A9Q0EEY5_9TELE|nr:hypothetical protein NHX12_030925 [Muraenolepis orangiensis]
MGGPRDYRTRVRRDQGTARPQDHGMHGTTTRPGDQGTTGGTGPPRDQGTRGTTRPRDHGDQGTTSGGDRPSGAMVSPSSRCPGV